ncbi:hypothetical protein AX17_000800 [Amanita inopinata Kibby_2008]|nr:hypothetical protein AX17_000800 [Amanita inopinata Kibby_2008]
MRGDQLCRVIPPVLTLINPPSSSSSTATSDVWPLVVPMSTLSPMHHLQPSSGPPLDYLRPSPVRGQLEPPDPNTLPGWRYIQTTDTPNEFKAGLVFLSSRSCSDPFKQVLLPPGTASMYEQLLKFEALELSRKQSISWERIMQIRHLKDRMIRKCQRLSKASRHSKKPSRGDPLTFQTIMAPADFRVKEMEKWFREQHKRTASLLRHPSGPPRSPALNVHASKMLPSPCNCPNCTSTSHRELGQLPSSSKPNRYHTLPSSTTKAVVISHTPSDSRTKVVQGPVSHRKSARVPESLDPSSNHAFSQPLKVLSTVSNQPLPVMSSPPPLPILLRSQRSALGLGLGESPMNTAAPTGGDPDSPEPAANAEVIDVNNSPAPSSQDSADALGVADLAVLPGSVEIRRRRSCIKRSSIGEIPKTVSWADEPEWEYRLSKYADAAKEAQSSDRKWEEIREIYLEQMSGLDALSEQVGQGLTNLRVESEQLEHVEKTIAQQRETLHAMFKDLEQKQSLFQAKVKEALQDADHILSIAGINRDG